MCSNTVFRLHRVNANSEDMEQPAYPSGPVRFFPVLRYARKCPKGAQGGP